MYFSYSSPVCALSALSALPQSSKGTLVLTENNNMATASLSISEETFKMEHKDTLLNSNQVVRPMLTDFYQVTMAYAYWKSGKTHDRAVFDLYFRKNPFGGEFTIFAGLEECIKFVKNFSYSDRGMMNIFATNKIKFHISNHNYDHYSQFGVNCIP